MIDPRPTLIALGIALIAAAGIGGAIALVIGVPAAHMGLFLVALRVPFVLGLLVLALLAAVHLIDARDDRVLSMLPNASRFSHDEGALRRHDRPVQYRGLRRPVLGEERETWSIDVQKLAAEAGLTNPFVTDVRGGLVQFWDLWDGRAVGRVDLATCWSSRGARVAIRKAMSEGGNVA